MHWFKKGILQGASSETLAPSFPWIGIEEHSAGLQTAPLVIKGGNLFKLVLNWPELPLADPGYICKFLLRIVSVPAFKNTTKVLFRSNVDYPTVDAATLRAMFRIVTPVIVAICGTSLVDFAKAFKHVSKRQESTDGVNGIAGIHTLWITDAMFPSSDCTRTVRRFMEGLQLRTSAPNGKLRKLRLHCCTLTRAQMARIEGFPLEVCWDGKLNGCRRTTGQRESDWSANGDETEATDSTESRSEESDSDSDDSDSDSDDSDEDSDDSDDSNNDNGDSGAEDGDGELDDANVEVDAAAADAADGELNGTDIDSDGEEDFEDFFNTPLGQMTAYAYMTTSLLLLNQMDRDDELVWY
ncbi:hypothetical protein EWM64_g8428 [Hericium alpestre]|uniref:Uncharacterized protein n=1 Tax=Hericium alpestre TaxID=135208 RepID=A0A4Y9ZMV1_9AGAM|nr:hypothetical protein EWM64_g8428 [Hericium alpestre]